MWDKHVEVAVRDHKLKIEYVNFTDWHLPNTSLQTGELDANAFQLKLFVSQFNANSGGTLRPINSYGIHSSALYSSKHKKLKAIPEGGSILTPTRCFPTTACSWPRTKTLKIPSGGPSKTSTTRMHRWGLLDTNITADVLIEQLRGSRSERYFVAGTPDVVADEIERSLDEDGIDGINLRQYHSFDTLTDFGELVVPELRKRGRLRDGYVAGETLRERIFGPGQQRLPAAHPGAKYREIVRQR